jgi:gamma-glutamyltranspeptidase/glutathione hydrolase
VANHFKLVGAEANSVAPGKRPLSSMSPTIVLENNKPILTVGAAGGPRIITQVVLAIINYLDLHETLEQSLASPRFHHQWSPDLLSVEPTMPKAIFDSLRQRGFKIDPTTPPGATQAISVDADGHTLIGASEPRVPGKAAGVK